MRARHEDPHHIVGSSTESLLKKFDRAVSKNRPRANFAAFPAILAHGHPLQYRRQLGNTLGRRDERARREPVVSKNSIALSSPHFRRYSVANEPRLDQRPCSFYK